MSITLIVLIIAILANVFSVAANIAIMRIDRQVDKIREENKHAQESPNNPYGAYTVTSTRLDK